LRLRMGIGRPSHGDISAWVLSPFSEEEKISLENFLKGGGQALELLLESGFEKASRHFSKKKILID